MTGTIEADVDLGVQSTTHKFDVANDIKRDRNLGLDLLEHLADTLETLSGSKYFSTVDLSSGYWQVSVHPNAQHKTAFTRRRGLLV